MHACMISSRPTGVCSVCRDRHSCYFGSKEIQPVLAVNAVPSVNRHRLALGAQDIEAGKFTKMIRTGWSRLTTGWGTTNSAEGAAIDQLLNTHRALLLDGGRAEVGSEAGYSACAIFLSSVETAAKTFGLEAAPRGYRKKFSANYRALFPDDARHYRVDVLEASADQHSAIWVNGDKFELSPEAICHAEALQKAWSDLTQILESCASADGSARHPGRSELCTVLDALDVAWAGFEHKYIAELIEIEEQARRLIIKAVELEARLSQLEDSPNKGKDCIELKKSLVQGIAHLNSVANFRRKGRDDLGFDILESAADVLSKFGLTSKDIVAAGEGKGFAAAAIQDAVSRSAGVSMAVDVVGSFEAMRRYLREVKKCLERVDPHLCNNVGLVARPGGWQESWEIGARYVRQRQLFEANNDIVAEFRTAQSLAPAFTTMCTDCDVELFLVLPRMVILSCLEKPNEPRAGLLRSLLPHRFPETNGAGARLDQDSEMGALLAQFKQVRPDSLGLKMGSSRTFVVHISLIFRNGGRRRLFHHHVISCARVRSLHLYLPEHSPHVRCQGPWSPVGSFSAAILAGQDHPGSPD
ncbi:unnamed protein product [Effrenium voratum]|nr:unnamed protein product [Effrenium voratum]